MPFCRCAPLPKRRAWPRSCTRRTATGPPGRAFVLEHDRMTIRRRAFLGTASAELASLAMPHLAKAQSAGGALLLISESGANSVDPHTPGANRGCYEVAWNTFDSQEGLVDVDDESGADHAPSQG